MQVRRLHLSLALVVAMVTIGQVMGASNYSSLYGELPEGNYNATDISTTPTGGLSTLFSMARGFVDVVFKSFDEVADFITDAFSSRDPMQYLLDNWQTAASYEAGFIACLVFGLLFIVFVPFVGSIMCCCRCCCGNCGGRYKQSEKRSKSCWRQCLCVTMLILTTFMAIPTVFVFLTNEWVTDVVTTAPVKTVAILTDATEYLNLVPRQLTYMTEQYDTVDNNVRPLVEDFGVSIGEPLQESIEIQAEPALQAFNDTIAIQKQVLAAIDDVMTSTAALKDGTIQLQLNLTTEQNHLKTATGSKCNGDLSCMAVESGTSQLELGFDPSDFDSLNTELADVQTEVNSTDLDELYSNLTKEIDSIPQKVREETTLASKDAIQVLDDAKTTINDMSANIPTDQFDKITGEVESLSNNIENAFNNYNNNFDKYRYIAGVVLGSMLAVIVFFYYFGLVLGICGHQRKVYPSERSGISNCGGIMLMVGVGLSFIFSWLLMILVVVTFTIGGHGERYGCQGLDPPEYKALALADDISNINLASTFNLPPNVTLGLVDLMKSCEMDQSAYEAFKLEYIFNVTSFVANVTKQTAEIDDKVDKAVNDINLSNLSIYSTEDQQELMDLKSSGLENIDFADYLTKLGNGITQTDLLDYADGLDAAANNMDTSVVDPGVPDDVRNHAQHVRQIHADYVVPIQGDYDRLNASIRLLMEQAMNINSSVDTLDDALTNLNYTITQNGATLIEEIVTPITDQVINNITSYTTWVSNQLTTTLGACKPIYDSYIGMVSLFCDYLIDTINGLWFSLGWCVFFLVPSAIIAMKLMKFFRVMEYDETYENDWENLEMNETMPSNKNFNDPHYY